MNYNQISDTLDNFYEMLSEVGYVKASLHTELELFEEVMLEEKLISIRNELTCIESKVDILGGKYE